MICLFPVQGVIFHRVFQLFAVASQGGEHGIDIGAAGVGRGNEIVPAGAGGNADGNNPESAGCANPILYPEADLKDKAAHIAGLGVSRKAEIAQGVADVNAIVAFDGVETVRMMPDDQIGARIHGEAAHFDLIVGGRIIQLVSPMEGDDDQRIILFGLRDVGGNLIPEGIIAVDAEIGEHGDLYALGLKNPDMLRVGPDDARVAQRLLGIRVALLPVIHHVIVFEGDRFHTVGGEHGNPFGRGTEKKAVVCNNWNYWRIIRNISCASCFRGSESSTKQL